MGDVDWDIRWLVTQGDALPYALIGNDFWPHAKANVDWTNGSVSLKAPDGHRTMLRVHGIGDTVECCLIKNVMIPAGQGYM